MSSTSRGDDRERAETDAPPPDERAAGPGRLDGPAGTLTDSGNRGLTDLLTQHIKMVRGLGCVGSVSVLMLDDQRRSLREIVASDRSDEVTQSFREVGLIGSTGPIASCVIRAETDYLRTIDGACPDDEAAVLESLGPPIALLPLMRGGGAQCWANLRCGRRDCPAYGSDSRCWLESGTVCRATHGPDGDSADKLARCLRCPAFGVVGVLAVGIPGEKPELSVQQSDGLKCFASTIASTLEASRSTKTLLRLNADLEERVARASDELRAAHRKAMQSEKLATAGSLVAGLAHQFNNPLAVISTCAQSLRLGGGDETQTKRNLEIIAIEVRKLSRLVNGLVNLARDRASNAVQADLGDTVQRAVDMVLPAAARSNVSVHVGEIEVKTAMIDKELIHEVLVNLLANAIQAMPLGGRVEISVRGNPADKNGELPLEFTVSDDGPGMDSDLLDKVFEPFFTTRSRRGGTGLGLPLSLSIVERLGGTIIAESIPGEGATFRVRLPASLSESDS